MKRALPLAVLSVMALFAASAHAQFPPGPVTGPGYRPPVSPYLNLLRAGSDPAINYYGIVRPEIAFQRSIQGLQQQVNAVGAQSAVEAQAGYLVSTGHPIVFNNYSHYFGNPLTGAGAGSRLPATTGRAPGAGATTSAATIPRPTVPH